MKDNIQKAYENLSNYTIKATEKAILDLDRSIQDKKNLSVKEQLEQRQKELDRDLDIIKNYLNR